MIVFKALVCYAVAVAIPVAAIIFLFKFFGKKFKLSVLHMIIGMLSFFGVIAAMLFLLLFVFSKESTDYMTVYIPEGIYKTAVAALFFALICVIRYFFLNSIYFSKFKENKGTSFLFGYGIAGSVAVAIYCLFMFSYISYCCITSSLVEFSSESVFKFADYTVIVAFEPFVSHILLSVIFVVYAGLMLIQSKFMTEHSNNPFSWKKTFGMFLLLMLCEICMASVVLFAVSRVNYYVIIGISAVIAVLAAFAVKLLYKYKEENPYEKQFD